MDDQAETDWLDTHIPHRVRAAVARLPIQDELLNALSSADAKEVKVRCEGNAIWEGRLAAVRWLIEFIGVKADRDGQPAQPKSTGSDVSITMIAGGKPFDLASPDAVLLAGVWKACSQASSHATHASGHASMEEEVLDKAVRIVMAHLDQTVYATHQRRIATASLHVENR